MNSYGSHKLGFTLVELVVTMSILVVIAVGVIIQFQSLSPSQRLENASDVFRSALVALRTTGFTDQQCCGGITPDGYGLSITLDGTPDNTIFYFADLDNDHLYSTGDQLLSTTILNDKIDVISCASGSVTTTSGTCTFLLAVSQDSLQYNGAEATGTITFTLADTDRTVTTSLNIYANGVIE